MLRLPSICPPEYSAALRTSTTVGDGPAAFLILIVGTIVAVAAILVQLAWFPPWWVHLVWLPIIVGLTVLGLRLGKAALVFQEFKHQAHEGRIVE